MAKTTSGFNSDHTIRQHAHGLLLESPFVPSRTNCWAVRAKIRQNGRLGDRRGETGSRNMVVIDPGFLFTSSDSFSQYKTSQTTDRRQTDRRHSAPKARPIVRSANKSKNSISACSFTRSVHLADIKIYHKTMKSPTTSA